MYIVRWEVSFSTWWYNWGLGVAVQFPNGHYPFSFTIELGPLLFGIWGHTQRSL